MTSELESKHSPIVIDSNSEFTVSKGVVAGNGSESDPFVIEGWEINASNSENQCGILISGCDAFFIIRNCTIYGAGDYGIYLNEVSNGLLLANNCSNNYRGISGSKISDCMIKDNDCSHCNQSGINIGGLSNITIEGNRCSYSEGYGIAISGNYNLTVLNNNCSNCLGDGIFCTSRNSTIVNNSCSNNGYRGIAVVAMGSHNVVCGNLILSNYAYGVEIYGRTNLIFYNTFIGNNGAGAIYNSSHRQAYSDETSNYYGDKNRWNSSDGQGNYWGDWITPDGNHDGIVDNPYIIDVFNQDNYPLANKPN